jgi:hypothetical protein
MSETPDRIAIDADGFGWRVWDDQEHWSMVPTNPDNEPVPHPLTWYVRFGYAANGGTLDADRIVNDAFHQQYADRSFPFEPRAVTADLKAAAGLEGDGLVVLRYEGDAVTVAGRLDEVSPPAMRPDVRTDGYALYRITAPPSPRSAQ